MRSRKFIGVLVVLVAVLGFVAHKKKLFKTKDFRPHLWSVGILEGPDLLHMEQATQLRRPAFTAADIHSPPTAFVADPFLVKNGDGYLLFFEMMNKLSGRGEIGVAESADGKSWKYMQQVLVEPFHLSYPLVFEEGGQHYMIPESRAVRQVRLYKATDYPTAWKFERVLFEGNYADSSIVKYQDRWWMFTGLAPYSLAIWHSDTLTGRWVEHKESPFYRRDSSRTRPGGRPLVIDGKLIRFSQDNRGGYGKRLRAFQVDILTPTEFVERPLAPDPLFEPTGNGWRFNGMHHFAPVQRADGSWIAAVDGNGIPFMADDDPPMQKPKDGGASEDSKRDSDE
ncbi:MAG: hypothetical protein EBZ48_04495 [Proteobacteria bacterium]|nr:hypothetical protein [Pseudomonadota bacterium]